MKTDINFWRELKNSRPYLTKQQYKTLRGQAANGHIYDAQKGLQKVLKRRNGV